MFFNFIDMEILNLILIYNFFFKWKLKEYNRKSQIYSYVFTTRLNLWMQKINYETWKVYIL